MSENNIVVMHSQAQQRKIEFMSEKDVAVTVGTVREFFRIQSDNPQYTIKLWHRYLCDEPRILVQQAFDEYISSNKFSPSPAEILELIEKAKWKLWQESQCNELFGEKPRRLPDAFTPRSITRIPKRFETINMERAFKSITDVKMIEE